VDAAPQLQSSPPSSPTASQKSPSSRQKASSPLASQPPPPAYDPAWDNDPLLRTQGLPKMPSKRILQALLAEPPLSYVAARAKPLDDPSGESGSGAAFSMRTGNSALMAKPGRWFCAVCGYWGKVRCKYGCGERVCGLLECWRGHEGVCTLAATAY
jgi:zinc finger HIT domain-containing protein 1